MTEVKDNNNAPTDDDDWGDNNKAASTAPSPPELEVEEAVVNESGGDEEEALKEAADDDDDDDDDDDGDEGGIKTSLMWKSRGGNYDFSLDPIKHCVWVLLFLRFVERASWYGYQLISPGFNTGQYQSWSPGFSNEKSAQFQATTAALVNTVPFIIGVGADCLIGDYWMLIVVLFVFFVPGSILIFLSSWPFLLGGGTFPLEVFKVGILYLYPFGGGGVDTIGDIFGAKQFHPILQDDQIEKYFVWATVANAGGGTLATVGYALLATASVPGSFLFMAIMICIATLLFTFYTKRYVVRKLLYKEILLTWKAGLQSIFCWKKSPEEGRIVPAKPGFAKVKASNGGGIRDDLVDAAMRLLLIIPVVGLFIPMSISNSSILTFMLPQSYSMKHSELLNGTLMSTMMNVTTLIVGILLNKTFYPYLERKNISICTTRRVAIGASFLTVFFLVMYAVDRRLRRVYAETGEMISIGWQVLIYFFGGMAFPFFVPPMDELTFRVAPSEYKIFGNAINKFMQAGIGAFISKAIFSALGSWFQPTNGASNIMSIEAYTTAKTDNFMLLMAAISAFQALFLLLPPVEKFVKQVEEYVKVGNNREE